MVEFSAFCVEGEMKEERGTEHRLPRRNVRPILNPFAAFDHHSSPLYRLVSFSMMMSS